MQNISFKSTIRPIKTAEYYKFANKIDSKFNVKYPWTIKESVKAVEAKTANVYDCSVLGITDGKEVLMMHLCPTIEENKNFDKIRNFILEKISLENPDLQAILIGSQTKWNESISLNRFLLSLINSLGIPCSVLSNAKNIINISYSSNSDEWLINSSGIDNSLNSGENNSEKILKEEFDEVSLSQLDDFA